MEPEARARASALRRVGLLSPRVIAREERYRVTLEVDASRIAQTLGDAFAAELAAEGISVVRIAPDDPSAASGDDVRDLAARYGVDAVWVVEGETVRSAGLRGDLAAVFTLPLGPFEIGTTWQAARTSLEATLVDASGAILFHCSLDDLPPEGTPSDGDDGVRALAADLQDPVVAWAYGAAAARVWRDAVR
jgi:hypothetical protein